MSSDSSREKGDRSPSFSGNSRTFHGHNVVIAVSAAAKAAPMMNMTQANMSKPFLIGGFATATSADTGGFTDAKASPRIVGRAG